MTEGRPGGPQTLPEPRQDRSCRPAAERPKGRWGLPSEHPREKARSGGTHGSGVEGGGLGGNGVTVQGGGRPEPREPRGKGGGAPGREQGGCWPPHGASVVQQPARAADLRALRSLGGAAQHLGWAVATSLQEHPPSTCGHLGARAASQLPGACWPPAHAAAPLGSLALHSPPPPAGVGAEGRVCRRV